LNSALAGAVVMADIKTRLYIEKPIWGNWEGEEPCSGRVKARDGAVKTA
jgi:hypothetical protein